VIVTTWHRLALPLLVLAACRDPSVGPPPRSLDEAQARRVSGYLLKSKPTPSQPADVTLGSGSIHFLGTDLRPAIAGRGQAVRVSHYFEVLKPIERSWKLFVHLQGSGSSSVLVNADHVPVDGLLPTDRWQPGQIIEDSYSLTVPTGAPSELDGYIGFYRFDDRMPVDQRQAQDGANRIRAFHLQVSGQEPTLPEYRAPKRKGPIVIDGALGDEGWKGVPSTGAFVRSLDGGPAHYRTEAKLAWDDEALYVAFDSQDEDIWAKLDKDDDPIYGEEVVEIFLDANADGRTYNELELSPRGVKFDAYFPARRQGMDLAWSSGMETAVKLRGTLNDDSDKDDGWSAEMRIPVSRLAAVPRWPPQAGDRWRFNLYRLEWHSKRKVNEGSAFSPPLVGDFHHLPRFGWLVLVP
jgi:hypothetical protein